MRPPLLLPYLNVGFSGKMVLLQRSHVLSPVRTSLNPFYSQNNGHEITIFTPSTGVGTALNALSERKR